MTNVLIAIAGMSVLGLFWGVVLVIVNKVFHVDENPLIEKVTECLPGANCGACGFAGCGAFGEAIVEQEVNPGECPVCESENRQEIAKLTGREVIEPPVKLVAKLHCSGDNINIITRADYAGMKTCKAEHITAGGSKACKYGCLGLADCIKVCPFDALKMGEDGLPKVDEEKCASCGKCVEACPRGLFKMVPLDQRVFVLCSSKDSGGEARKTCKVACIGCKICEMKEGTGVFTIKDYLAYVDYEKAKIAEYDKLKEAQEKCPQKIITLL
jgi:RnfABCDGE-type electron transport complex B subunit